MIHEPSAQTKLIKPARVWRHSYIPSQKTLVNENAVRDSQVERPHCVEITGTFYDNPGKPVLHFLHGNGFCAHTYWPLLEKLSAHFALCLTDLPGHGASAVPQRFPTWRDCADAVLQAVQAEQKKHWGDRPVYALAHSMGGVMTTVAASQAGQINQAGLANQASQANQAPALFKKIVLLDPVWFPRRLLIMLCVFGRLKQSHRLGFVKQALRRRSTWASQADAVAALQGRGIYKGWEAGALANFVEHNTKPVAPSAETDTNNSADKYANKSAEGDAVALITPPTLEAWYFSRPYTAGLWSALAQLQTPVHAIYGDATYPFVAKGLHRAAAKNAYFTCQQTAGGHCFMLQDSAATAELVLTALSQSAN